MTLLLPRDIGGTPNLFASISDVLETFSNPVGHIIDGTFTGASLTKDELPGIACGLTACSSIYICESSAWPVAGFLLNETLRRAKLAFLIDNQPGGVEIPLDTRSALCRYMSDLFKNQRQIDSVGIPGDHEIEPLEGQTVDRGPTTVVSLVDLGHRPQSSRD